MIIMRNYFSTIIIYKMEFHVQSVEDSMFDSLNFKLGNSTKYVIDRKSVAYHPTGGSEYNPGLLVY